MENRFYKTIISKLSIIATASIINIIAGVIRTKILAYFLGPVGVGVVGLVSAFIASCTSLVTLGLDLSATKRIAENSKEKCQHDVAHIWLCLTIHALIISVVTLVLIKLANQEIYNLLAIFFSDNMNVEWVGYGIIFSILSISSMSLLQGMRQTGTLARITIFSALLNLLIVMLSVVYLEEQSLFIYIIANPLLTLILSSFYAIKIINKIKLNSKNIHFFLNWKKLTGLGLPLMGAGLLVTLSHLYIKAYIEKQYGVEALGNYQAAWTISMQYVGFLLTALAVDYFPNLSSRIHNKESSISLINQQIEVCFLICAPIFVAMIGFSQIIVTTLYSESFLLASEIFRWQIVGDFFKVLSWPLAYVILAKGASRVFFFIELWAIGVYIFMVSYDPLNMSLMNTGFSYAVSYFVYLPVVYLYARIKIGFRFAEKVKNNIYIAAIACILILMIDSNDGWAFMLNSIVFIGVSIFSVIRLIPMFKDPEE